MKIAVMSDIHSEFWAERHRDGSLYYSKYHPEQDLIESVFEQAAQCDVLIAAGDIGNGTLGLQVLAERVMSRNPKLQVVALAGNHEFYNRHIGKTSKELAVEAQLLGIHWISPGVVEIDGLCLIGATLWTDYRILGDPRLGMQLAGRYLNDHAVIRHGNRTFSPAHALAIHKKERAFIERTLAENKGKTCIAVTHHLPHPVCVSERFKKDPLTPAFASDFTEIIERHKPALWVYGHTHDAGSPVVADTQLLCSPWGYPNEPGCWPRVALVELSPGGKPHLPATLRGSSLP